MDSALQEKGVIWLFDPPGQAGQYELVELEFTLRKVYDNPYDADEVGVDLIITDGNEKMMAIPCFFTEEYVHDEDEGKWTLTGKSSWKARYTPDKPGDYNYHIRINDIDGTIRSQYRQLSITSRQHKGFIRNYTSNYLLFEDGSPFFANSFNLCIPPRDKPFDYEYFFKKWKENRMNYTRLWLAPPWGKYAFALEWTDGQFPTQKGKLGLKRYNQEVAARLDNFMQTAEQYNIYVMLCLGDERELETGIFRDEELPHNRPFWHANPYNRENGGPAASPLEFFILEEAKALYKNRLRYLIARWGYSTNMIIWEFWNEIDHPKWCQDWTFVKHTVANWHKEMGEYIRKNDPYNHLISTSFSHDNNQPLIWNLPEMDVVQAHNYGGSKNLARGSLEMTLELKMAFPDKPMFISEYGTDFHGYTHEGGAEEVGIHNAIWATALSGATGIAQWWWWNTIDENNLYFHYNNLGIFVENIPWLDCKSLEVISNMPEMLTVGIGTPDKAWVWVHNTYNNWDNAKYETLIKELTGIHITLKDFSAGKYKITEFDTYSGEYFPAGDISFESSPEIVINRLVKDKAYYILRID
jgi:hypothetical protein